MKYTTIRLILGDQLDGNHSWFQQPDKSVLYVIAELQQESTYVRHHIQKICAFFAAMKAFADTLTSQGHQVLHLTLNETEPFSELSELIQHLINAHQASHFEYQRPDEFRLAQQLADLELTNATTSMAETEHFLLPFQDIPDYFVAKKHVVMEHFYRKMRRLHNILMHGDKPEGGKWNFDKNNRQKLKPDDIEQLPSPLLFSFDTSEICARLERHNIKTIGHLNEPLIWPTNRSQSLALLAHFCQVCLPNFGRFQDAMTKEHLAKWSLYHCRLSFSLNTKMLHPREVIDAAIAAFKSNSSIDIAQLEGFVRQLLGWREYIRGVYWANMPQYQDLNVLKANQNMPDFFWTGKSKMTCLNQAISQSLDHAYAHHIQRLMITGNFSLLTELDPQQVEQWYLGIYIDAIEWVEMPNTRGMALFADGGIVGTKPYAASASYVNKMSDYCKGCHYDHKKRTGENACPFNSLYWRFMVKHRERLWQNPRVRMIYGSWDNMDEAEQHSILETANHYFRHVNSL